MGLRIAALRGWLRGPLLAGCLILLLAVLLALRKPWALHTPQLWAEDGFFFHQARELGAQAIWHEAILAVNLPRLRIPPLPDHHWADYAGKLRAGEAVTIPINPGWQLPFPERKRP